MLKSLLKTLQKLYKTLLPLKRKASRPPLNNPKSKRSKGAAAAIPASPEAAPAAPPKVNSQGRNIVVPAKYR
jgi:hypothetical protein